MRFKGKPGIVIGDFDERSKFALLPIFDPLTADCYWLEWVKVRREARKRYSTGIAFYWWMEMRVVGVWRLDDYEAKR